MIDLTLAVWFLGTQPKYRRHCRSTGFGAETFEIASGSGGEKGALQTRTALSATTLGRTAKGDMGDVSYRPKVGRRSVGFRDGPR